MCWCRDLKRDRLISGTLLRYSYLISGVMSVSDVVWGRERAVLVRGGEAHGLKPGVREQRTGLLRVECH